MVEKKVRYARVTPRDNIALALVDLPEGEEVVLGDLAVRLVEKIPYMHKFCVCEIAPEEPIIKKGEKIGLATKQIHPGEHIHIHNMKGFA